MFAFFKAEKRLTELEERVATLERDIEEKDMDWVELRARCRRLLDRTEKAAARVDKGEAVVESERLDTTNGEGALQQAQGRTLTPHQIEIQQKILRRRAGV